eukprot:TRINITY_DN8339_c0_g1_i1.p1 TRINITY_DN8339_c0_g1~~TRINITY_DN8339_c0_g1_i1.p1  ORF type:complete len:199 (+),score=52.94 TRINITY_DN8339_c0_g1_i1:73-597(+)
MNKKERRRSSAHKTFKGDYLKLSDNISILKIMAKQGDKTIKFSDYVCKVNHRLKMQERILMITDTSIYNLEQTSNMYKVKRRIAIGDLGLISMSTLPDNFFAIHIPIEYDYLMVSSRKIELVIKLLEAYERLTSRPLQVNFSDRFEYKAAASLVKEIVFTKGEGGVNTAISKVN